jgi:hypothetical protein
MWKNLSTKQLQLRFLFISLSFEFPGGHQRGQQWNARRTALFTSLSLSLAQQERDASALGVVAPALFLPLMTNINFIVWLRAALLRLLSSLSLATTAAAFCRDVRNVLLPYDDLIM